MLYLWLVTRGSQAIKSGERYLVDRRDRRDRSLFRSSGRPLNPSATQHQQKAHRL